MTLRSVEYQNVYQISFCFLSFKFENRRKSGFSSIFESCNYLKCGSEYLQPHLCQKREELCPVRAPILYEIDEKYQ